jgi:hypothetical protein
MRRKARVMSLLVPNPRGARFNSETWACDIMEKAATYKMKKNLEVRPSFQGDSFDVLDPDTLVSQTAKMNIDIGINNEECVKILGEMIDSEKVN